MRKILPLVLLTLTLLVGCMPTPAKVNEAIGRGQLEYAVEMLTRIMNENGQISSRKLDRLLHAFAVSHHFTLDIADDLFDRLRPAGKSEILRWYMQRYLEAAEAHVQKQEFEAARELWRRHQKVRNLAFPDFREAVPVLGVISLREADYWSSIRPSKPLYR